MYVFLYYYLNVKDITFCSKKVEIFGGFFKIYIVISLGVLYVFDGVDSISTIKNLNKILKNSNFKIENHQPKTY